MSESKQYFTMKEFFDAVIERAKADPYFEHYNRICELDYDLLNFRHETEVLYRPDFDVVGEVAYGGSEGIYGDISLHGQWSKAQDHAPSAWLDVYTLKTLREDKESYLAIGMLVNLICYHANEVIAKHPDRFD